MIRYFTFVICLLVSGLLHAQSLIGRNSVRIGLDLTSLDAPDDVGPRYVGRLTRNFINDRLVVAAEAGYMRVTSANQLFNTIDPGSDRRERFTADATVFVDALPSSYHALRLGTGVSAWYRRDDLYRGAAMIDGESLALNRRLTRGLTTGWHLAVEYEWLFNQRWGIDARLRVAQLYNAGISSSVGAGINYRF